MYIANQNAKFRKKNGTNFSELVDTYLREWISMRMQVALDLLLELLKTDRIIISTLWRGGNFTISRTKNVNSVSACPIDIVSVLISQRDYLVIFGVIAT